MRNPSRPLRPGSADTRRGRHARLLARIVEELEPRCLLSGTPAPDPSAGVVASAVVPTLAPLGFGANASNTTPPVTAITPTQIQNAYGFSSLFPSGTYNANAGKGQTIAIVDAYNDPTILNDANVFSAKYGLPSLVNGSNFSQWMQSGTPTDTSGGWELETALDVEWAHAIAPQANIMLVEAPNTSFSGLLSAVDFARQQPGVVAVSMSWGGSEFTGQSSYDSYFTSENGQGITFVAASGDSGAGAEWPASSANVLGVGGTTLNTNGETAWSGSGGGSSQTVSQPLYQASAISSSMRGTPDVAYDADPSTGFAVYDSYSYSLNFGWFRYTITPPYNWTQVGGTSAGAPQWAALVAVADGIRGSSLDGPTQVLPALYSIASSSSYNNEFHDITSGSNGTYSAGTGYDLVTGLGSPNAANLVRTLASVGGAGSHVTFTPIVVAGTVNKAVATPHDVVSSPVATQPNPGSTTTTQTTATVIVVNLSPTTAPGATPILVLIDPTNLLSTTAASHLATVHATADPGNGLGTPSVTVLSPVPTTGARPVQPLAPSPAIDHDAPLRLNDEVHPFAPIDPVPPEIGWEFAARDDVARDLDLLAIARQVEALGRVSVVVDGNVGNAVDPTTEPIPTDLTVRDPTPPLDPVMAGLVVTLTGALTLRPDRTPGRRRRLPWPRPGR